MKKLRLLALGLMCGIIFPLSTQAHEDGIYTGLVDENGIGVITVIFGGNDTFSGVEMTLKAENQSGNYYRGFNENTANSVFDDYNNPGTGTYMSGDGKMHGGTYGTKRNNLWGGSGDTYENGFNPNPTSGSMVDRQGPCDNGYHVPSRGEWNALAIAWCNLDEECNATYYDATTNPSGDLRKASNWTSGNQLIYISKSGLGTKFKDMFGMSDDYFWSSSPYPELFASSSWNLCLNAYEVYPAGSYGRTYYFRVRCLKNSIVEPAPQTFTLTFLDDDKYVRSGEIESGGAIPVDIISGYNLTGLTKEGYAFSGWIISGSNEMFDVENDVVTTGMTLNAARNINQYTITFDTDGGSAIEPITADYGTGIIAPANPTKNGYKFVGWDKEIPTTMPAENLTIKAVWEKLGSSGGGGGRSSRTSGTQDSSTSSQNDKNTENVIQSDPEHSEWGSEESSKTPMDSSTSSQNDTKTYSTEFQEAYEFAKGKGITTMPTIQKADMNGKLTRIAMAKMLSQYAMNVLRQKPANIVTPKFKDVTDKQNSDYDDGVTLAYQLGIMGQNMPNNKFRPNDEVTRAEFAAALSRMLYHTSDGEYKSTDKYYTNHMKKLVQEGIITNDDAKMKELRGYVMIMLMRSAK